MIFVHSPIGLLIDSSYASFRSKVTVPFDRKDALNHQPLLADFQFLTSDDFSGGWRKSRQQQ
jgi:hypothetical protein